MMLTSTLQYFDSELRNITVWYLEDQNGTKEDYNGMRENQKIE